MNRYNPIKYYKKFKGLYKQFVVFIKCGAYYTYDNDAKIVRYIIGLPFEEGLLKVEKIKFSKILRCLHNDGLNVAQAGSKNVQEYYTEKQSQYLKIKARSRRQSKFTYSGVRE